MTVASLWKALDRAGCGKHVGAKELLDHQGTKSKTNPWNFREMNKLSRSQQPVLAVDLSIWICEALGSSAMKDRHIADPALQLVYSRVLKLLSIGIKLVVVVEGKRRNRIRQQDLEDRASNNPSGPPTQDKFRKRRSGTLFWTACERCEKMLKLLGVIVVRAKAEGEALCALLNQRGIVDGVISNDGDCLLFGAKVLYTKFSVENLERSQILRYDANTIRVMVDDDDTDRFDETRQTSNDGQEFVELSRKDLIAFAILTGSDLAGDGLSKVGCRKAIRFIRKCQIDNPLKLEGDSSPALEQLLSWEQASSAHGNLVEEKEVDVPGPRCGCCGHPGTKRDHKKYGCNGCGTKPGEACFHLSPGGRFRKQMRAKALSMQSSFDPSSTLRAYYEPNENQIPLCLVGKTARKLEMNPPQTEKILQLPFIIRGRSLQESRECVRKSLSVYLARQELLQLLSSNKETAEGDGPTKLPRNPNRPTPVRVSKLVVRNGKPSCEVQWIIKATTSDDQGNPLNEFEFSTIEDESIIQKCHPKLLQDFREEQKKIQKQGTAEQEKRRNFLLSMEKAKDGQVAAKKSKARKDYFEQMEGNPKTLAKYKGVSDDVEALMIRNRKKNDAPKEGDKERGDVDEHIGRLISTYSDDNFPIQSGRGYQRKNGGHREMLDDSSTICTIKPLDTTLSRGDYFSHGTLTPGHEYYLGIESAFQFRGMAGDDFQPRIDYKGPNSIQDKNVASVGSEKGTQEKASVVTKEMLGRREPPSELYDIESIGLKRVSFGSSQESESSFFEASYARRAIPLSGVDETFRPVDEEPNFLKKIEHRDSEPQLFFTHHNDNGAIYNSGDEQNLTEEYDPRKRLFLSNWDSSDPSKDGMNIENTAGFYPLELPFEKHNTRSHGDNERNQARIQDLESNCTFHTDEDHARYRKHGGKWDHNEFQRKSYNSDSWYGLSSCKRGRKRHRDHNGEFCCNRGGNQIDTTDMIKIDELVAAKVESQNRRARVRILCSKFIEE